MTLSAMSSARSEAGRSKIAQEASLRLYGEEGNLRVGEKTLLDDIVDAQIALIARLHHTAYHYACASPAEGAAHSADSSSNSAAANFSYCRVSATGCHPICGVSERHSRYE